MAKSKAKSRDVPADADLFPHAPASGAVAGKGVGKKAGAGKAPGAPAKSGGPAGGSGKSGKARTTPFLEMQEYEADEERSFPGYCIGHYDKDCDECRICEIRDPSCMEMTRDFESLERDEKEDGDGEEEG